MLMLAPHDVYCFSRRACFKALVETRASILIASYTNSAVDNILLKLLGSPVSFVRLGSGQAVHPAIRPYMPGGERHPNTSVSGLQELMARVNVVSSVGLRALRVPSPGHHVLAWGPLFGSGCAAAHHRPARLCHPRRH